MAPGTNVDPTLLTSLRWRCIGPFRGGRVVAVAGHPTEDMVFYFGASAGGVWKTDDGGTLWQNISDGYFETAAVGAIAIADSDPNVIYAGTGEACIRGNVSHGDGVYRSTDGGKTWANVGLRDSRHISRIRVHPDDPDMVYVAALGHAFGPNEERGVFSSRDGGANWERVLYKSENAGAADLTMDPSNPRIMYAAIWQARRQPWSLESGGPDGGIHKTTDGGDTWTDITANPGLPAGTLGRVGVSASPAKTDRVWAVIEAEERGLYRSDNGGDSWNKVAADPKLIQRPWYYAHVFADPVDSDTVYVANSYMYKSTDGGHTFDEVRMPHGDHHDLWIDPRNPRRMVQGNDGGACVSFNGGGSWSSLYNQPTSQFYRAATDNQFPYRMYATQQDNTAISVPSRSHKLGIPWSDCYTVGNSESGQIAVHPEDPNIVYSGGIGSTPGGGDSLMRYDHRTQQVRTVTVWPELYWGWGVKDQKYRFQWTYPITFSPHDPGTLYAAANVVFRSRDEGSSWEIISPDLTRDDRSKMETSGGPLTKDTTYVEHYGTIFTFVESPHQPGVFWAGSDDGLVHISHDGGGSWTNITPPDLPEWTSIQNIEPSHHDPATAYVAATRYKLDDTRPYLYVTRDYGKSWAKITNGIPEHDFTRVIREDPAQAGLLYAGTETGLNVSLDGGGRWQSLQANLPTVPVSDLVVKDEELVAATHGRSFWILDDLTLVRQLAAGAPDADVHLFQPAPTYRIAPAMDWTRPSAGKVYAQSIGAPSIYLHESKPNGEAVRTMLNAGEIPQAGVLVTYYSKDKPEGEVTLAILDDEGTEIKIFRSKNPEDVEAADSFSDATVPAEAGMNRFLWNMRYPNAAKIPAGGFTPGGALGPLAPVGSYQVRLSLGDQVQTQQFELIKDPRITASQDDLDEQFGLLLRIRNKITETHDGMTRLQVIRRQVDEWMSRGVAKGAPEALSDSAGSVKDKLALVEGELVQIKSTEYDRISQPARLNAKLAELTSVVASADAAPTKQSYYVFDDLSARVDVQLAALQEVVDTDLARFVDLVHELEVPAISPEAGP